MDACRRPSMHKQKLEVIHVCVQHYVDDDGGGGGGGGSLHFSPLIARREVRCCTFSPLAHKFFGRCTKKLGFGGLDPAFLS